MTTIVLIILLLMGLSLYNFFRDRNKYLSQTLDKQGGMKTKYEYLISQLLKEPSTRIIYQDRVRIVLERLARISKEEYIITETFGELQVDWKSDMGRYGKQKKTWTFNSETPQIDILKEIRKYMISLISEENEDLRLKTPIIEDSYGITASNPILVKGVGGELTYLSSLRTNNDEQLFFHRLGSFQTNQLDNAIDIYEVVSVESISWGILYFDMYSAINSTQAPKGYYLSEDYSRPIKSKEVLGASTYLNNFPMILSLVLNDEHKDHSINLNIRASYFLNKKEFMRTPTHILKVLECECIGSFFPKFVKNCSVYPLVIFTQLLVMDNIKGYVFVLRCLQRLEKGDGTLELYKLLSSLCINLKDLAIINEVVNVIEKIEPDIHNYWQLFSEASIVENAGIAIPLLSVPVDEETKYLSTPYLFLMASNKRTDPRLVSFCLSKIEQNTLLV